MMKALDQLLENNNITASRLVIAQQMMPEHPECLKTLFIDYCINTIELFKTASKYCIQLVEFAHVGDFNGEEIIIFKRE